MSSNVFQVKFLDKIYPFEINYSPSNQSIIIIIVVCYYLLLLVVAAAIVVVE